MTPLGFAATPEPISWRRQVREHLATLPPGNAADDLAMIEAACLGHDAGGFVRQQRLLALLRGARNDQGIVAIDGQRALLDALRERAS